MSAIKRLSYQEEEMKMEPWRKQGIVAILGEEKSRNAASIRRTLSADMSSKIWIKENGFFSLVKRNRNSYGSDSSSSSSCSYSSSSESEDEWERIPAVEDVWKKTGEYVAPEPYVHPMVKRSAGYMSEKSLQMCTEPLGSETGADCCSSCYSCTRVFNGGGDGDGERVVGRKQRSHFVQKKKSSVPPPLSSVSGADGTSLCIQSRRENGRLVIEAVPQAPRNRFITERKDGRLVLRLERVAPGPEDDVEDDGCVEEKKEPTFVVSENLNTLTSGLHKLVIKRLVTIGNKNPNLVPENDNKNLLITPSLPSPPRVTALLIPQPPSRSPSFNAYEYFWRSKTTTAVPTTPKRSKNNRKWNENLELDLVVKKGNRVDYFSPFLKGCKETRKSILFWGADCIPTS